MIFNECCCEQEGGGGERERDKRKMVSYGFNVSTNRGVCWLEFEGFIEEMLPAAQPPAA